KAPAPAAGGPRGRGVGPGALDGPRGPGPDRPAAPRLRRVLGRRPAARPRRGPLRPCEGGEPGEGAGPDREAHPDVEPPLGAALRAAPGLAAGAAGPPRLAGLSPRRPARLGGPFVAALRRRPGAAAAAAAPGADLRAGAQRADRRPDRAAAAAGG